jgi:hypothetical protein
MALVRTDVSVENIAVIIKVTRIGELVKALSVSCNSNVIIYIYIYVCVCVCVCVYVQNEEKKIQERAPLR